MILNKASDAGVIKSNIGTESSFSIAMNGKAFRVLSDTIYKDKIGSLVREISCNAYDSHVQAGRADVPFTIHLPDAMEPYFAVTDYGLGLSADAVRSIFTQYFNSTKDNSNDVIGAFGLGSKTPFAYTDSFTVTSTYNGETIFYSAYLNDDGVPSIAELGRQPSDGHNGVEIKVPVNRDDFRNFQNAVAEQLRFFNVKPEIKNCANFAFATVEGTDILKVSNLTLNRSFRGIYVIQGQVGYPLTRANSGELAKLSEKAKSFLDNIEDIGGTLIVPIGKIEVIASREGISYSKVTIASLNEYLELAADQVKDAIADRLSNATTDWERACVINTNHFFGQFAKTASDMLGNNAFYANYGKINVTLQKAIGCVANQFYFNDSHRYGSRNAASSIQPTFDTVFVYKDTMKSYVKRINLYFDNQPNRPSQVYIINPIGLNTVADISKALGGAKVIAVSDMPEPPKSVTVRGARGDYKVPEAYSFNPSTSNNYSTRSWNRLTDFDPEEIDNIAVVKVEKGAVEHGNYHTNYFKHIASQGYTIVGIRVKDYEKFMKNNPDAVDFVSLSAKVKNEITSRFASKRYKKLAQVMKVIQFFDGSQVCYENVRAAIRNFGLEGTNIRAMNDTYSRLKDFVEKFKKDVESFTGLEQEEFNDLVGKTVIPTFLTDKIKERAKIIKENVPLILWYSYWVWNEHHAKYVSYFDKIDT